MDNTGPNTLEKVELSHVLFHSKFASCLICKKFFGLNATNRTFDALTHVRGKNHRKLVKSFFRKFINDPFCITNDMKYLDVLKNIKLDISLLLQASTEGTYIYEKNDSNLFCSVCHENVSNSTDVDQIKIDLVHHLNTKVDVHVNLMKNSVSWIYNLNDAKGSIIFHKAKVFCTVCDISLEFDDDLMLHSAVGHLQTKQHKFKIIQLNIQDLVTRAGGSGGHGLSATPKLENSEVIQTVQQIVNNSFQNIDKMTLESIRNLAEDHLLAPHVRFLKIEGCNLMCTLCDVPLTISKSKNNHLKMHILGSPHRKASAEQQIFVPDRSLYCSSDKVEHISTTPLDQIQKLAEDRKFAPHVKYFEVKGRTCRCVLCNVTLSVSIKVNHNLKEHILGKHSKLHENLQSNYTLQEGGIVGEASSNSPNQQINSTALDPVLLPNLGNKNGNLYSCSLCKVYKLSQSTQIEHIKGAKHKKQIRKSLLLDNPCSKQDAAQWKKLSENVESLVEIHLDHVEKKTPKFSSQIKTLTRDPTCLPHLEYLYFKDRLCHCTLCQVPVPCEKRGFLQHVVGAKHKNLFEIYQSMKMALQEKHIDDDREYLTVLSEFKKLAQDQRCAPHLLYIKKDKNQYLCSVCNVHVPKGKNNVKAHIMGAKHMKRFEAKQ